MRKQTLRGRGVHAVGQDALREGARGSSFESRQIPTLKQEEKGAHRLKRMLGYECVPLDPGKERTSKGRDRGFAVTPGSRAEEQ